MATTGATTRPAGELVCVLPPTVKPAPPRADGRMVPPQPTSPSRNRIARALLALTAVVVGLGVIGLLRMDPRAIAGATDYSTFGGPHGKLLAVGAPWGQPCMPLRLEAVGDTPAWIRGAADAVASEARRGGLDVRYIDTSREESARDDAGMRLRFAVSDAVAPLNDDGQPMHILLHWDAQLDADGKHEYLTVLQAELLTQTIGTSGSEARRALRQLLAMGEGINRTTRRPSGLAQGEVFDRFTAEDIAAMKHMGGCA